MNFSYDVQNSANVLFEMMLDRGHKDEHLVNLRTLPTTFPNRFTIDLPELRTGIIYDLSPKFSYKEINEYVENYEDESTDLIIFVIKAPMNTADVAKLEKIKIPKQIFSLLELQYNKSKHVLVPKHELINDPALIEDIVAQHDLKSKTQFPHILRNDPMCKHLNARPGDLIRVHRVSPTSAVSIIYRTVV